MVSAHGEQESLDWCQFVLMKRVVCNCSLADSQSLDELIGFNRLIVLDTDDGNLKLLLPRNDRGLCTGSPNFSPRAG